MNGLWVSIYDDRGRDVELGLTGLIRCNAEFLSKRRQKASPSDGRRAATETGMWGRNLGAPFPHTTQRAVRIIMYVGTGPGS